MSWKKTQRYLDFYAERKSPCYAQRSMYAAVKLIFDSQGNVWVADNSQVGAQAQDCFWQGHVSKFARGAKLNSLHGDAPKPSIGCPEGCPS